VPAVPGSVQFNGTNQYLSIASNSQTALQSNDFTIEGWFYFTNANENYSRAFYSNYTAFGGNAIYFGKHSSNGGNVAVAIGNYSTVVNFMWESTLPPANQWVHYALVRTGSLFSLYRNGVLSVSNTFSGAVTGTTNPNYIGAAGDAPTTYSFPGYISNFRIINGAGPYNGNFTPSTSPLTAITNTALLTLQSPSSITDASVNLLTLTNNNSAIPTYLSPFTISVTSSTGIIAIGGGGGGNYPDSTGAVGSSGGGGGGAGASPTAPNCGRVGSPGALSIAGLGYPGGRATGSGQSTLTSAAGGGGGAGAKGGDGTANGAGGSGGTGTVITAYGTSTYYGGGGGGGSNKAGGVGGLGGGGAGGSAPGGPSSPGTNGTNNTGGGGGGGAGGSTAGTSGAGGTGGPGVVILSTVIR
jgi:hypothetical protein